MLICERVLFSFISSLLFSPLPTPILNFPILLFVGFKRAHRVLPALLGRNIFPSLVGHQFFLGSAQILDRGGSVKGVDGV